MPRPSRAAGKAAGEVGYHVTGPPIECSTDKRVLPGLDEHYNSLWASPQRLDHALRGSFCSNSTPGFTQELEPPSCHTRLFHGRLDSACLAARNLSIHQLPCVRTLLITAFPGSGTLSMSRRLGHVLRRTHTTRHEAQHLEPDVLLSWIARSDVWRLGRGNASSPPNATCGLALREDIYREYRWTRNRHTYGMGSRMFLNRCLYRKVLLQTREPLAAIRSVLSRFCTGVSYFIMADQLIARSGSARLGSCVPPISPPGAAQCPFRTYQQLNNTAVRRPLLRYLLRLYWHWMGNALDVADGHFALEDVWHKQLLANGSVCQLAGLPQAMCHEDRVTRGIAMRLSDNQTSAEARRERNSHSSSALVQPVTWKEAHVADKQAATLVRQLAARLGYRYRE